MASRGTGKWFSIQAETRLARAYGAVRSPSSGASVVSKGDATQSKGTRLVLQDQMFESKHRGSFTKPAKSTSITLEIFEKLANESYQENREPVQHISLYAPSSLLADCDGYVDFVVRLMSDDVRRENLFDP